MWDKIKNAVGQIIIGNAKRVDGDEFTAYAVGSNVIRIDLKVEKMFDPSTKLAPELAEAYQPPKQAE